jgi:predicted nucleic acid-binding protein
VARQYLLDTNILSHLVRQPQGRVAERIAAVGEANVLTSVIAAHARAIDAVCVTDNVAEFKRVPALRVENWLRH